MKLCENDWGGIKNWVACLSKAYGWQLFFILKQCTAGSELGYYFIISMSHSWKLGYIIIMNFKMLAGTSLKMALSCPQ